jgi:hypothetical protein
MASTYEKIANITASNNASIDFNSITGSYTDLVLICNFQPATAGQSMWFTVNGSTTGYSYNTLYGTGITANAGRQNNQPKGLLFDITIGSPTTLTGVVIANFMNYSNTTTYKTVLSRGSNATTITEADVTLWQSTSAISSISIYMSAGNITAGTFTLYGIAKA